LPNALRNTPKAKSTAAANQVGTGAAEAAEQMVAKLPIGLTALELYGALRCITAAPFVLEPRARLLLEIHELREFDKHQRLFLLKRQAKCMAHALGHSAAEALLQDAMVPEAMELAALQAMLSPLTTAAPVAALAPAGGLGIGTSPISPGAQQRLAEAGVAWNAGVELQLRRLLEQRSKLRRQWWQRQREYLLQDLEWSG